MFLYKIAVGEDYNTAAGILTFNTNADNPQREFYTILGDAEIEPDETFPLRLSAQTGGVRLIGDRTDALVTIVNDDCKTVLCNLFLNLLWDGYEYNTTLSSSL